MAQHTKTDWQEGC